MCDVICINIDVITALFLVISTLVQLDFFFDVGSLESLLRIFTRCKSLDDCIAPIKIGIVSRKVSVLCDDHHIIEEWMAKLVCTSNTTTS